MDDWLMDNYISFARAILMQHIIDYQKSIVFLYKVKDTEKVKADSKYYRRTIIKHINQVNGAITFFDSPFCLEIVTVVFKINAEGTAIRRILNGNIIKKVKNPNIIDDVFLFMNTYNPKSI